MFKKLDDAVDRQDREVTFTFDGQLIKAHEGQNLVAALLAAEIQNLRLHPVTQSPRSAFCMMGSCYECLVEIDGQSRQACQTLVRENMTVSKPKLPVSPEAIDNVAGEDE